MRYHVVILGAVLASSLVGCRAKDDSEKALDSLTVGEICLEDGRYEEAVAHLNSALILKPDYGRIYIKRGRAYEGLRDYTSAIADYTTYCEVEKQRPYYGHQALGWLYATCPDASVRDGKKAVTHAVKACELSNWEDFDRLRILAAAHAEAGNFQEAVQWQQKGFEFPGNAKPEEIEEARERLRLYEAGKPYHEPQ